MNPSNECYIFNFVVQAMVGKACVGAIVCKLDMHRKVVKRGYIAMLAVDEKYRKKKIGKKVFWNTNQLFICCILYFCYRWRFDCQIRSCVVDG